MRSRWAAFVFIIVGLGGCAPIDGEPVAEAPEKDATGICEDLCYEIYLGECAQCMTLPRRYREPCFARAADRLGACLKRCP